MKKLLVCLMVLVAMLGLVGCGSCKNSCHNGAAYTQNLQWYIDVPATCGVEGHAIKTCPDCGVVVAEKAVPKTGMHNFSEWTVAKEPTYTEKGYEVCTCTDCGFSKSRELQVKEKVYNPCDIKAVQADIEGNLFNAQNKYTGMNVETVVYWNGDANVSFSKELICTATNSNWDWNYIYIDYTKFTNEQLCNLVSGVPLTVKGQITKVNNIIGPVIYITPDSITW